MPANSWIGDIHVKDADEGINAEVQFVISPTAQLEWKQQTHKANVSTMREKSVLDRRKVVRELPIDVAWNGTLFTKDVLDREEQVRLAYIYFPLFVSF